MWAQAIEASKAQDAYANIFEMKRRLENQPFKVPKGKQPNQTYSRQKKHTQTCRKVVQLCQNQSRVNIVSGPSHKVPFPVSGECLR